MLWIVLVLFHPSLELIPWLFTQAAIVRKISAFFHGYF
jgi:hypothetical protein